MNSEKSCKTKCYNCDKQFDKEDLTDFSEEGYGHWCDKCLDAAPGNQTGYCPTSCCLGYGCDQSC